MLGLCPFTNAGSETRFRVLAESMPVDDSALLPDLVFCRGPYYRCHGSRPEAFTIACQTKINKYASIVESQ
jgi:hypothetical protein